MGRAVSNYELTIVVEDVGEDQEIALLDEGISLLTAGRLQQASVEASGDSFLDAVKQAVAELEGLGVRVKRVHLDLVTKSEIAQRAGVTKPTVDRWAHKVNGDAFPVEHAWGITGPVWAWGDVNEWLRRNGKETYDGFCTLNHEQVEEANHWLKNRGVRMVREPSRKSKWLDVPAPRRLPAWKAPK